MRQLLFYIICTIFLSFSARAEDVSLLTPTARNGIVHIRLTEGSGIGNRLKKLVSYIRYYQPHHINIYWEAKGTVTARFSDLFQTDWNMTEYNAPYLIKNFPYDEPLYPYIDNFALLATKTDFKNGKHMFIDGAYQNIPPNIINIYRPYFTAIKPSPAVQKRIAEVRLPKNAVAVQIRNAPDWQNWFQGNEPLETFFALMDKHPKDTIFYLSAMSKEVAAPFYKRYPNRIIELPHKDYHSMVDAVADMFIIGQTKNAIYAYGSSFSEVGWWLGGAKAKVEIAGTDKHWKYLIEKPKLKVLPTAPVNLYKKID